MIDNDDRTFVIDSAIRNGLGSKDEIELYEQLSIALELSEEDFDVIHTGIGDGIDFGITTPYPNGLPETIGILFYDVDFSFNVNVKEIIDIYDDNDYTPKYGVNISHFNVEPPERYFAINIKKC